MFEIPDTIKCFLRPDNESGSWVGHCLDFDLVTSGKTEEIAWTHLKAVVKLHIEHCFTHDHSGVGRHRAPQAFFDQFDQAVSQKGDFWSDRINLNLVAAQKQPDQKRFWIRGLELEQASSASLQSVH